MFTGNDLANYALTVYANKNHWCYWYATYGNLCTLSRYEGKRKQYPYPKYNHYKPSRKSGYIKDIELGRRCADCVGFIKSFFWTGNKYDTNPVYNTNNCPDTNADGMFKLCKKTGDIKNIPDIPGLVVWKSGHIGVYVGEGYTIEFKGFDYDCQKNKVTAGKWKKWGMLPPSMITYIEPKPEKQEVMVTGGSVYIRTAPSTETGKILGVVHKGDILPYQGEVSEKGWYLVEYKNQNGWISGKYSVLYKYGECENCTN